MPALTEWKVPPANQPRSADYAFDLDHALASIVGVHSIIPPDAFTADTLGTERAGNGVIIDDGLVLTIGYLITEAEAVWLHMGDGRVVQGHALGFDAVTGPLTRIDIRGTGGRSLMEKFVDGPRSYLGIQTAGFPNFFIVNAATFCNLPRCLEWLAEWVSDAIGYLREKGFTRIEATPQAEDKWTRRAEELAERSFMTRRDSTSSSWAIGANIPGKKRAFLFYARPAPAYRKECEQVAAKGYQGFELK